MRRWAFNVVAAVSLVLCVGTVVMWVRSYGVGEAVGFSRLRAISEVPRTYHATAYSLWAVRGRIGFRDQSGTYNIRYLSDTCPPDRGWYIDRWVPEGPDLRPEPGSVLSGLGFYFDVGTTMVPLWLGALITSLLPAAWFARRLLRIRDGFYCVHCGYDLRATRDRCPECGTPTTTGVKS